jgi:Domain of unknown function (DUF4908)
MANRNGSGWFGGAVFALLVATTPLHADDLDRIGHFETTDGTAGFVLDLSGETPRGRFDNSPEILLLKPSAAARGDTVYRLSDGTLLIRGTPFGSLTLYSAKDQDGTPVVRNGEGVALTTRNRSEEEVMALATALEQRLSMDHHLSINVEIPPADEIASQPALNTLGDAIENTQIAIDRVANLPDMTRDLGKVMDAISFVVADRRAVDCHSHVLIVRFAPALQLAGRPSSYDIADRLKLAVAQMLQDEADLPKHEQHSFDFQW